MKAALDHVVTIERVGRWWAVNYLRRDLGKVAFPCVRYFDTADAARSWVRTVEERTAGQLSLLFPLDRM